MGEDVADLTFGFPERVSGSELEEISCWIVGLERLVHEPSRLAILTMLCHSGADDLTVKRLTGLSKDNLSNHLAKLEEAELVIVSKHFEGKKPVTNVDLTTKGKATIEAYYSGMVRIAGEVGNGD